MQKKVKNRVAKRAARKLKREEGTIDEAIRSVNQRHNMEEGKSPYDPRKSAKDSVMTKAPNDTLPIRKLCLFATQHQFQLDSPMDSAFDGRLQELIRDHKVDCILEEATGIPPKSCVELLADELGIPWVNIDLTVEQRKETPDSALTGKYDTLQDLTLHSTREKEWMKKISETVVQSGLVIVGLCHLLSMGEKLRALDFDVEAHVYDPSRIYDWKKMRPRVARGSESPK